MARFPCGGRAIFASTSGRTTAVIRREVSIRRSIRSTRSNVQKLAVAWPVKPSEDRIEEYKAVPGNFQATPLMIGNVLYLTTATIASSRSRPSRGKELWAFDPKSYVDGPVPNGTGFGPSWNRGVARYVTGDAPVSQHALSLDGDRREERQLISRIRRHGIVIS